jgi:2-succinyl-6-hydroxy-2,4-cyclohexadiene-1-carboxylate synthase
MATRPSLLSELVAVRVPTMIVCGVDDAPFVEPSQAMHEAIPGSELVMIEGAGHSPQIETPGEFNRILLGFLTRIHEAAGVA